MSQDPAERRPTFAFVSLGCPKNLVDSERMLGLLAAQGYAPVADPDGADMVVVNTCGFIEASRRESRAVIDEMTDLKKEGKVGGVLVTGCLAERVGPEQLITEIPLVDQAVGVFGRDEVVQAAERFRNGLTEQRTIFRPAPVQALDDRARLRVTPRHFAYLKISEGCDRTCTFCAIPKMRGKHVTKPIDRVVEEAQELVGDGVRELILVSQDTTYYGLDHYGEVRLKDLLGALDRVDGLDWIRILYAYPEHLDAELVDIMAGSEKIVPYLDMPLQHANDRVLKRMQRRHNRETTDRILRLLRDRWPGLTLRTTFIVGFPGETAEQFEDLVGFVRDHRFERMGVFTYSLEEGTPAVKLDGHLPEEIKEDRRERLMLVQQEIAFEVARSKIGQELDVIVDGPDAEPGVWIARTEGDSPDIDTVVFLRGEDLRPGVLTRARIEQTDGYDLRGVALGEGR